MTEQELIQKATKLIRRFDNMRILGARGEWSGSARQGFMFNPRRGGGSAAGGGPTPPPETGACCLDYDCLITTEADCLAAEGIYRGNGSTCDDFTCTGACCCSDFDCYDSTESDCLINVSHGCHWQGFGTRCDDDPQPCPTGACCREDVCTIETAYDCGSTGGIYKGDNTECDPNPCAAGCDCFYPVTVSTELHGTATPGLNSRCDWDISIPEQSHTFTAGEFNTDCDVTFDLTPGDCVGGCSADCGGGSSTCQMFYTGYIRATFACETNKLLIEVAYTLASFCCLTCPDDCGSECDPPTQSSFIEFDLDDHGTHTIDDHVTLNIGVGDFVFDFHYTVEF